MIEFEINELVHSSNLLNLTIATAKNETAKNKNELYFLFKNLVNDFIEHTMLSDLRHSIHLGAGGSY